MRNRLSDYTIEIRCTVWCKSLLCVLITNTIKTCRIHVNTLAAHMLACLHTLLHAAVRRLAPWMSSTGPQTLHSHAASSSPVSRQGHSACPAEEERRKQRGEIRRGPCCCCCSWDRGTPEILCHCAVSPWSGSWSSEAGKALLCQLNTMGRLVVYGCESSGADGCNSPRQQRIPSVQCHEKIAHASKGATSPMGQYL